MKEIIFTVFENARYTKGRGMEKKRNTDENKRILTSDILGSLKERSLANVDGVLARLFRLR